jgi:predicted NBD/HSP70 family sugar kinase
MSELRAERRASCAKLAAMPDKPKLRVLDLSHASGLHLSGTNLERAGDHNQRVTLHAIRVNGPITRAELADITGLTAPAIASITKRLLSDGLIQDAGRTSGARGQPAIKLIINPDSCFSIGVNIDRDHITMVVLDFAGRVRGRNSREVSFATPDVVQTFFRRSIGRLLSKARIEDDRVLGVGVAIPDEIQRQDLPDQPPQYAIWGKVAIDKLLQQDMPLPIFVENDAAAAAMGEMHFGLGHRYQSFFYVLITAALGGGLVIDGNYFRGAKGRSGELGMLRAEEGGESRQLQKIVSLSALYTKLAARGYQVESPKGLLRLDAPACAIVDEWIEGSTESLLDAIFAINCLINPEAVLIGGRLPAALVDRLADRLNERLRDYSSVIPAIAPVSRAATSDDAPAVGAAILPFSNLLLPTRFALMKAAG